MKKNLLLFFAIIFSVEVYAAGPQCSTKVTTTRVSSSGGLYLSAESISNGQYIALCSVASPVNNVAVDTCKSWLSILQSAQVSGRSVMVSYKFSPEIASCNEVPVSSPPSPYFVQLTQ